VTDRSGETKPGRLSWKNSDDFETRRSLEFEWSGDRWCVLMVKMCAIMRCRGQ
jgi:hypothetical protein